jgi:hypothetical protein
MAPSQQAGDAEKIEVPEKIRMPTMNPAAFTLASGQRA